MKNERRALNQIKSGESIYVDCKTGELELEGSARQEVKEITPKDVDNITINGLRRAVMAKRSEWDHEIARAEAVVEIAHHCRNAYFWTPGRTAESREYLEDKYTDSATWEEGGDVWEIKTKMEQNRHFVTFWCHCYRNGKKTNIKAVKNSIQRLKKVHGVA